MKMVSEVLEKKELHAWEYFKTHKDGTKSVALKSKDWMLDHYELEEFPADDGLNGISTLRELIDVNLGDYQSVFDEVVEWYWDSPITDVTGDNVRYDMALILLHPDSFSEVVDRISIYPLDEYEKRILASGFHENLVDYGLDVEGFDDETIIEAIEEWKAESAEEEEEEEEEEE
jgi:hypothetical protein